MKGGESLNNIRERREQLGISQKKLAERCGVAQSTICDIEQGRINPSLKLAVKIAQVLKVENIKFYE